jgi:hypothetical protein
MIVALQADPKDFFGTKSLYGNAELLKLVEKAASMGFKAVQIGPMTDYVDIESKRLRKTLDSLKMERNVHVGGIFDAEGLATTEQEYQRMRHLDGCGPPVPSLDRLGRDCSSIQTAAARHPRSRCNARQRLSEGNPLAHWKGNN